MSGNSSSASVGEITPSPKSSAEVSADPDKNSPRPNSNTFPLSSLTNYTSIKGLVSEESAFYPSPINNNPTLNQSTLGTVNFNLENQTGNFHNQVDITVGKFVDWGESYFDVKELYSAYQNRSAESQWTVGRRLQFWSEVDSNWKMGEWQPLENEDPLRPQTEGLTGFFYQKKMGEFELMSFASPIFVPTMGPSVQDTNGELTSNSRWYTQPTQYANILGQPTQMEYNLTVPQLTSLVAKPGGGIRLMYGSRESGSWTSVNYAYKPINSLQVEYDANLLVSGTAGTVDITPVVAYTQLYGWDMGYSWDKSKVSLSYLADQPIPQLPTNTQYTDYWEQQPTPMQIMAVHMETQKHLWPFREDVGLSLDYLKVIENITWDVDSTGVQRADAFPYRAMYTNAVSAKITAPTTLASRPLVGSFKALRDFDQQGNVFQTMVAWKYTARLLLDAGVDVISPDNNSMANVDPRFINEFRANNRFYGGAVYAF